MNCLLIEDEPLAMLRLKEYVSRVPFLKLAHAVDNPWEAMTILREGKIDLIFLDIEMDGMSGIQLLDALPKRPAVILTTAYAQYALKAFDLQVADYLLKPFTFDRFLQAVLRIQELESPVVHNSSNNFLFVKSENRLQKIMFDDILFIEGMRDYRRIWMKQEKMMTLETFGQFQQRLPPKQFCRVHKSYLVSIEKIESIERDRIKILKEIIPVSLTYKEQFYDLIGRKEN